MKIGIFQEFCSWLFTINFIWLISSLVYQCFKKDKNKNHIWNSVFAVFLTIAAAFIYGLFLSFVSFLTPEDNYADNLKIPEGITINIPIGDGNYTEVPDSLRNMNRLKPDFILYNSFQPGLYEYDIWYGKIEKGIICLKAYEVTNEDRLSSSTLEESSEIRIYNPSENIIRFGTKDNFTIYEGDWGKPYTARFEVWFKPQEGEERKLFEKIYKIEGWMR